MRRHSYLEAVCNFGDGHDDKIAEKGKIGDNRPKQEPTRTNIRQINALAPSQCGHPKSRLTLMQPCVPDCGLPCIARTSCAIWACRRCGQPPHNETWADPETPTRLQPSISRFPRASLKRLYQNLPITVEPMGSRSGRTMCFAHVLQLIGAVCRLLPTPQCTKTRHKHGRRRLA